MFNIIPCIISKVIDHVGIIDKSIDSFLCFCFSSLFVEDYCKALDLFLYTERKTLYVYRN